MTKQKEPVDDKRQKQTPSERRESGESVVTAADLAKATNLSEIMDLIGKQDQARGLTQEKLDEILAETRDI